LVVEAEGFRGHFEGRAKAKQKGMLEVVLGFAREEIRAITEEWVQLMGSLRKVPYLVRVLSIQTVVADLATIDIYEWERIMEDKFIGEVKPEESCCARWR
jgi:hypothetical protein